MATRYEIVHDHDAFFFQLRMADGDVVLRGLDSPSKIMVQNEILHLRNALRDDSRLVPHDGDDGERFVVVKDRDGSVLARSKRVDGDAALRELVDDLLGAAHAPIIDLARPRRTATT